MALPQEVNVTEVGLGRLISQWKDKDVVQGVTKSILDNIQVIEDQNQQILRERGIFEAIGAQLDVLGLLVGEARLGRVDEPYRVAILNRIAVNTSDGTPVKMMEIMRLITGSPIARVWEHYPASAFFYVDRGATNSTAVTLQEIAPAGVSTVLLADTLEDSLICSDLISLTSNLVTNNIDNIVTDGIDSITASGTTDSPVGERSFLPELTEGVILNPLCDVLLPATVIFESGLIINDNSDFLAINDGSRIRYQTLEVT